MYTWLAKVICLVILLILTVVFGFIPRFIRTTGNERYLSIANCIAGGVLMGTTLLHLVPEVLEDVENGLKMKEIDTEYPIGTLVIGIGFLIIVFIEMLAHTVQDRLQAQQEEQEFVQEFMENEEVNLFDSMERVRRFTRASSKKSVHSNQSFDGTDSMNRSRSRSWKVKQRGGSSEQDPERQALLNSTVQNYTHAGHSHEGSTAVHEHHHDDHVHVHGGHGHSHSHAPPTEIKSFGSVLLLFALSVHSILEGMAVGSETKWINVFVLTGALSLHKILLAFALGVKIVEENNALSTHIKSIAFFATSSPIGVGIGIILQLSDVDEASKHLAEGLIQAVATGTFLYIAFVEIITPELNKPDLPPLLKVLFLAVGYGIMCLVQLVPEGASEIEPNNVTDVIFPLN